ncbi:hypothetical protein QQ045_022320 [Rhodiola kirilowii]
MITPKYFIKNLQMGLLSAYIIKTLYFGRHSTDREVALMFIMAYLSYMLAELISLSGILTVFFCGIVMSHYTWHNVTESSRITTKHAFATMSFISETFIFLYVGMDALDIDKWRSSQASAGTSIALSSTLVGLLMIGRAAFVFPLANIANCCKRNSSRICFKEQFIVWWAGLMRGAVTIALSYSQFASSSSESSTDALMITSSIIVVLFSTMVFGSITKPLIEAMLLRNSNKSNLSDATDFFPSYDDLRLPFFEQGEVEESSQTEPDPKTGGLRFTTSTVHYFWRKFDDRFMRPVFGGRGFVPFVPGTPPPAPVEPSTSSNL